MSNAKDFVIENGILKKYKGSGGNVVVPEGVTRIGDRAFSGCENLQSITLPEGVTSIGDWAFYNCKSLQSITLPEGVTSIGNGAFEDCEKLQSVTIPDISINEFKTIDRWRHGSYFSEGVSNKLILPEYIDGEPVGHIALTVLPDNAVVLCSDLVFQRLKRPVRTLTACAYLENSTEFPEKECSEIQKYIAKYSADVADKLIETANVQAVSRFLELVKLTPKLCDEMLKKAEGNVETTALILERKYAQCNSL